MSRVLLVIIGFATLFGSSSAIENKNCAKWNQNPKNGFCATATDAQKKLFCNVTCAAEIATAPADDCAIYVNTAGKVLRTAVKKATTAVATKATATDTLLNVWAKDKCKVDLYASATPTVGTNILKTYTGAAPTIFFKITVAAEQAAAGFVCTCT